MWLASFIVVFLFSIYALFRTINRNKDPYLIFVLSAIYLRYFLSAFPDTVAPRIVAGISINAAGAILVIFVGLFIVQRKYFSVSLLFPLYLFLGFMVFSGIVNFEFKGLITGAVRLTYLIILQIALFVALQRLGPQRVFGAILTVFILPVGLQAASILLSRPKGAGGEGVGTVSLEQSTGVSFIGPYGHESGFSIMLMSMLFVAMFWRPRRSALFWAVIAAGIVGLAYANYRTTILSSLPIILAILVTRYHLAFIQSQRAAALTAAMIVGLPIAYLAVTTTPVVIDRFESLLEVTGFNFSMSPGEYTYSDRRLLSSRVFIWSRYFDAIANSDFSNQMIGQGPEAWRDNFSFYAHNTYVSYYYEFGIIGVSIFALYWISNLFLCFKVRDGVTFVKLFSGYMSFTILTFATMPLWQIEGNLLLALLNGTLMFEVTRSKRSGGSPGPRTRFQDSTSTGSDFNRPV